MKYLQVVSFGLFTLLIACDGGGQRRTAGNQCPINYDPTPTEFSADQKVDLAAPKPGVYEYLGTEIYYVNSQTDFRTIVRDKQVVGTAFEPTVECVRNAKADMADISVSTTALTALEVDESGKVTKFEAKRVGFTIIDGRIEAVGEVLADNEKPDSLDKVFEQEEESFMPSPNDLEVRTAGQTADGSTFAVVSKFRKP